MYKIIAIIGKAGAGKDTLLQEILSTHTNNNLHEIISCTTRPPREGEVNGRQYYFYTEEDFLNKIDNHEMLEYTQFNSWYYGTALEALDLNKINIGVFNPAGVRSLAALPHVQLMTVYVFVDDKTRLIRQLNREEYPNIPEIIRRYSTDEEDFKNLFITSLPNILFVPNSTKNDLIKTSQTLIMNKAKEVFGYF